MVALLLSRMVENLNHLSRGMKRHINRGLAAARITNPGLTRVQFMLGEQLDTLNGLRQGTKPESDAKGGWCKIAQKHCLELNNPYRLVDFCMNCPSYAEQLSVQLRDELDFLGEKSNF